MVVCPAVSMTIVFCVLAVTVVMHITICVKIKMRMASFAIFALHTSKVFSALSFLACCVYTLSAHMFSAVPMLAVST